MPAADVRLTNTVFPTPETFSAYSVKDLLTAAAYGRVGVDRRWAKSILDRGDAAAADIVHFATDPFPDDENLSPLTRPLFLLLRHFKTPLAVSFMMDLVKGNLEELPEELMEAVNEIGEPTIDPLIALYNEIEDDELRGDVAFLLATFRNRDPRILKVLLDHFDFDAADGAIILESFEDPGAIPAIEKVIAEPELDAELRGELEGVRDRLRNPVTLPDSDPKIYDAVAEFPEAAVPIFDLLTGEEVMTLLASPSEEYRRAIIDALSISDMDAKITPRVLELARTDASPKLRGAAWEALAIDPEDKTLIAELTTIVEDASKPHEERSGALVGLASLGGYSKLGAAILDFYHGFPGERANVLKAMWRCHEKAYGKYMLEGLDSPDQEIQEQAILGIGNLALSSSADRLEVFFADDRQRAAALFSYALASPGETSRARMKSLFSKIDKLADGLDDEEAGLVEAAIDQRLAIHGLQPVFHVEEEEPEPKAAVAAKTGRNDPCPCGSGKKFKKCCGASA